MDITQEKRITMIPPVVVNGYAVIASYPIPASPGMKGAFVVICQRDERQQKFHPDTWIVWYAIDGEDAAHQGEYCETWEHARDEFLRRIKLNDNKPQES